MPPPVSPLVQVVTLLGVLSVPAIGYLLGRLFDRWCAGRPRRLVALSAACAAVASGVLLVLPLYLDPVQTPEGRLVNYRRSALAMSGLRAVGVAAIPVAVALAPLLAEPLLAWGRGRRLGRALAAGLRLLAAVILAGVLLVSSMSLVGLVYLPSVAAMAAAAVRSWRLPANPSNPSGLGGQREWGSAGPRPAATAATPGVSVAGVVATGIPLAFLAAVLLAAGQGAWTREAPPAVATRTISEPAR